jgi:hypothetical protein
MLLRKRDMIKHIRILTMGKLLLLLLLLLLLYVMNVAVDIDMLIAYYYCNV